MLNYFFGLDNFSQISIIIYFIEPASVFFTNLIYFHDEVCIFLVYILIFTYWMLYSILNDHIYQIPKSFVNSLVFSSPYSVLVDECLSIYNKFIKKFFIFLFNILYYIKDIESGFFFKEVEKFLINLNNPKADKILYYLYCIVYFIKFFFFSIFGFQYTSSMKFLVNFSFLNDIMT